MSAGQDYLADVVVKDKFGDTEPKLYVVLAANAKKDLQRTRVAVRRRRSAIPAVMEANVALTKANNALSKAESAFRQALQSLKDATERADESIKIRSLVIKCWSTPLGQLVKAV